MVTPRGWWDLADADLFYPDDLPADWRLSYFANCFRTTLLPAAVWTASQAQTAEQWNDDVPSGFRFAAERALMSPVKPGAHQLDESALTRVLGSKLDGWLDAQTDPASAPTISGGADHSLRYQLRQTEQALMTDEQRYAVVVPSKLYRDLRGARDWLNRMVELQGRSPNLIILERPTSATLANWQDLLELLGLG